MEITQEFDDASEFLFQNVRFTDPDGYDLPVVCREHKRFIPCRPCMYQEPAKLPYSQHVLDVKMVSDYHSDRNKYNDI